MIQENLKADCVISSPPYWSKRDYGIKPSIWDGDPNCDHEWNKNTEEVIIANDFWKVGNHISKGEHKSKRMRGDSFCSKCGAWKGTLGLEPNFNLYIKHLCDIYDLVKEVLQDYGTNWVNLGDTYGGSGNSSGHSIDTMNLTRYTYDYGASKGNQLYTKGYEKCLLMLPERFAIEMINRGWILRNVIIWSKPNPMPESAKDRFTTDFDYIYFFVKSSKTNYWINEKTSILTNKKPLGKKGIESIDWDWVVCEKCLGTGFKHKKCRMCDGNGMVYNLLLQPELCENCKGKGRINLEEQCNRCKGKGLRKYNYWSGRQYFFEQQRENLSNNPATKERYKYNVGNQANRKDINQELVKPGKAFSKYFPQDLQYDSKYNHHNYGQTLRRGFSTKPNLLNNPQHHGKNILTYIGGKNKRTTWNIATKPTPESHFATFPDTLVEIPIKAGCPQHICTVCEKPREKMFKRLTMGKELISKETSKGKEAYKVIGVSESSTLRLKGGGSRFNEWKAIHPDKFLGYTDCGCNARFRSGIVLDPFAGIGTTLHTAWKLGRDFIGFEISKEYCIIAQEKYISKCSYNRITEVMET